MYYFETYFVYIEKMWRSLKLLPISFAFSFQTSNNFTPAFGSVTNIFVGSHLATAEVIRRLLDKFKIENSPSQFALYMVKPNGGWYNTYILFIRIGFG